MSTVAVFDTNVLFSGLGWKGKPYQCLELARAGSVTGLTCPEILDELMQKLEAKLHVSPEQLTETPASIRWDDPWQYDRGRRGLRPCG